LPAVIADNLLEDKDSPIAPVLSILLTKLWQLSQKEDYAEFSVLQYQNLRKEGILMEDFFHQQMEKIRAWRPKYEESGLALDVLNVHTTALGTADSRALEELRQRYEHQEEAINELLGQFKDLYLLSDAGKDQTGLAHDTLAPIVIREARESDKSGQRALRILNGKVNDFVQDKTLLLDEADLGFVEAGKEGMRLWSEMERELVDLSIEKRTKNRKQRRIRRVLATTAVTFILVLGVVSVFSLIKQEVAQSEKGLTDLISLEHRVEDIQAIEGCPDDVLIEMKTIIKRFTSGSIISRVFIDNSPFNLSFAADFKNYKIRNKGRKIASC
jgi:hypothetical protein